MIFRASWFLKVFCAACLLTACSESTPSRFYLLTPIQADGGAQASASLDNSVGLAIGPIKLPKHLDRDQVVTHSTGNLITLSEFDRWAEPLNENFARVLAENLSVLVPTERVVVHPWNRTLPYDYQVIVTISRLHVMAGSEVLMAARWNIIDRRSRKSVLGGKSDIRKPVTDSGYESAIRAMSEAVAELSRDISAGLKTLPRPANS